LAWGLCLGSLLSKSIICERAFEFARRTLKLCDRLWNRGASARHIASQLMRCGLSIGANSEEAQGAQTKPDYIAKMSVSRKEARETIWWLRLLVAAELATSEETSWELDEAGQLLAMVTSAIRTAQSSPRRG
jgi:four helix bundle protein